MPFTPEERARIYQYLGYPLISAGEVLTGYTVPSGTSAAQFVVEEAIDRVKPEAEFIIREQLAAIACIVQQTTAQNGMQGITAVRGVQFSGIQGILNMNMVYVQATAHLSDLLHAPKYPLSELHARLGSTGQGCVDEPC
jgi:hypothetical protein